MKPYIVTILLLRRDRIGNLDHDCWSTIQMADGEGEAEQIGRDIVYHRSDEWPVIEVKAKELGQTWREYLTA
jgi:hypothetical protein